MLGIEPLTTVPLAGFQTQDFFLPQIPSQPVTMVGGGYDTLVRWVESVGYCLALFLLTS